MNSFDTLPIAAIINKAFFCVHGGLSPDITTLEEVKALERFQEIPREGPMCDLLWSDPYEEDADHANDPDASNPDGHVQQQQTSWFGYNETRQCSYVYGVEAVKQFLKDNKLTSVIRAHEAQVDGYKMQMVNKSSGIPRVITIFSAPNYCDVYKNKAACLKFDNNVLNIKQFIDSPHPYYLPNFMDVFQWSLPFVAEKVTDMLANVLDYEDSGSDSSEDEDEKTKKAAPAEAPKPPAAASPVRGGLLKSKVVAVSKLLRMYKILRQENEAIVQLKQLTPSHKVPFGLLRKGPKAIKDVLTGFDSALEADMVNEKRPGTEGAATATEAAAPVLSRKESKKEKKEMNITPATRRNSLKQLQPASPTSSSSASSSPSIFSSSSSSASSSASSSSAASSTTPPGTTGK